MKKFVFFMLSLAVMLAFSIGSTSGASIKMKPDSEIHYCISFEKSVVNYEVVPLMEFSLQGCLDNFTKISSFEKTTDSKNIKKKDLKPDCLTSSCRYDLTYKLYFSRKYPHPNYAQLKYDPVYVEPYNRYQAYTV